MSDESVVKVTAEEMFRSFLKHVVGEDINREGLKETPTRYVKALKEMTSGYGVDPASVLKEFKDGGERYDEMVVQRDIPVWSLCEHHILPFFGVAHLAYIPAGKVVGLSKLSRLVDVFAKRLQVQERMTEQIATALNTHLQPRGVAVVLECRHACMECRGVRKAGTVTTTSAMFGVFREKPEVRSEFFGLVNSRR